MIRVYMMAGLMVLISAGLGYHFWLVASLESEIADFQLTVQKQATVITRQTEVNEKNLREIDEMKNHQMEQEQELSHFMAENNRLLEEKSRYLRIFKDHNLTRLARAKPNLIERRINGGTASVFRQIEDDSQHTSHSILRNAEGGEKDD